MTERDWDLQSMTLRECLNEEFLNIICNKCGTKMLFNQLHVNLILV